MKNFNFVVQKSLLNKKCPLSKSNPALEGQKRPKIIFKGHYYPKTNIFRRKCQKRLKINKNDGF